jgi:peptide deformylase
VAVREILRFPDARLKQVAAPLGPDDAALAQRLAGDLVDTMHAHPGCVGLAATQLGELVRMVVVDVTGHPRAASSNGELLLVNPEIVGAEGSKVGREGCLSIPDLTANVRRAISVSVVAVSPDGADVRVESTGFEARCLQHELDHLDGVLFLDRVESLRDDVFRRQRYR